MRRRGITFISAVSLVLCLASGAMWIRSYRASDILTFHENRWRNGHFSEAVGFGVNSDSGGVLLYHLHRKVMFPAGEYDALIDGANLEYRGFGRYSFCEPPNGYPYMRDYRGWGAMGFGFFSGAPNNPLVAAFVYNDQFIVLPFWFFTVCFAMLPLTLKLAPRKPAHGKCATCGYDLRATPNRCPECGT